MGFQKTLTPEVAATSTDRVLPAGGDAARIGLGVGLAIEAAKGANEAKLEADIQQASDEFFEFKVDEAKLKGQSGVVSDLAEQNRGLFDSPDEDPAFRAAKNDLYKIKNRMDAKPQNATELATRIHAATRAAVTRMPGFANELRSLGATLAGDVNVFLSSLDEADTDPNKAEEDRWKSVVALGKSMFMFQRRNEPRDGFEDRVEKQIIFKQIEVGMAGKKASEQAQSLSTPDGLRALGSRVTAAQGAIGLELDALVESGGLGTGSAEKEVIKRVNEHITSLGASYPLNTDHPAVVKTRAQLEALKAPLTKFYSGQSTKEALDYEMAILVAEFDAKVYADNPEALQLGWIKRNVSDTIAEIVLKRPGMITRYVDLVKAVGEIARGGRPTIDVGTGQLGMGAAKENFAKYWNDPDVPSSDKQRMMDDVAGIMNGILTTQDKPDIKSLSDFAALAATPEFQEALKKSTTKDLSRQTAAVLELFDSQLLGGDANAPGQLGGELGRLYNPATMQTSVVSGGLTFQIKPGANPSDSDMDNLIKIQRIHEARLNNLLSAQGALMDRDLDDHLEFTSGVFNQIGVSRRSPSLSAHGDERDPLNVGTEGVPELEPAKPPEVTMITESWGTDENGNWIKQ
jgi:hypothetical protein